MTDMKQGDHKFFMGEESAPSAIIEFREETDNVINIFHTAVSDELGGQGIGTKLVEQVVDYANENHLKITASCSFARRVIDKFPEFKQFLAGKE
ncbi:GNAT family N-acetyltransferase [Staphylococcus simulans]|uniref:GNAT family N-acetyltransferase n=1 Tax=Staphylococcus simulans TaxID=1286 RepID=UPI003F80B38D